MQFFKIIPIYVEFKQLEIFSPVLFFLYFAYNSIFT